MPAGNTLYIDYHIFACHVNLYLPLDGGICLMKRVSPNIYCYWIAGRNKTYCIVPPRNVSFVDISSKLSPVVSVTSTVRKSSYN